MRTVRAYILVLLLVAMASGGAYGGNRVTNYGLSSGLSNGFVRGMAQDSQGFIWVATEDGLNRFDGHWFKPFTVSNSGLAANELNFVAPDSDNPSLLWVGHSYKLQVIRDSSTRLLDLINHILEFRKTETQNRPLTVARRNLANLVRETALRFKELNRNPKVGFRIDIENESPSVYFDVDMVTTILNNLLSNAVKYTPEGYIGVSFHTVEEGGVRYSEIKVSDTGYGISKEQQKRIFDRYYQVNGAHQASGTGIGLALVKSMVDLHKATIKVESAEGKGTTFTIRLLTDCLYPEAVHEEPQQEPQSVDTSEEPEVSQQRLTLLVVEDNDDIREYIRESLADEFEVMTAANGLEGLKSAQEKLPDIIISDIMMPEMDGTTMCRTLKEDILTSHIPVILLTAKDSLTDKEEEYDSGADSYLTKPFSVKLLRARIHNIIKTRRGIAAHFMAVPPSVAECGEMKPDNAAAGEGQMSPGDAHPEDPVKSLSPLDRKFMDKINTVIEENISLEDLSVAFIADKMCMSHSTLYRKIMAITGVSTNEYVRHKRMTRAAELFKEEEMTLTEVAFAVGFGSGSSFSKSFKKEIGVSPSEYIKSCGN